MHVADCHGEGDECRRHVEIFEATTHRILAADGADTKVDLRHQRAQHRRRRLAPAFRYVAQFAEIFLEAQVGVLVAEAGGHELGKGLDHGQVGAGELVLLHDVRVEAPCHRGGGGGFAEHGQLGDHGHAWGQLALAAERHEYGGGADGGVEAFGQALVGRHVDIGDQRMHPVLE